MPPQKYWMSGPFLAAAAALNAGIRPSVVCRTVLIFTFGCFFWYAATVSASHPFAPAASCSPHHDIVRLTGSVGNACVVVAADRMARPAVANTAVTPIATATTTPNFRCIPRPPYGFWISIFPPRSTAHKGHAHRPPQRLEVVTGEDLAAGGRDQHDLLDPHPRVVVAARLERDDHSLLEHDGRARDDARRLVEARPDPMARVVRVLEGGPGEGIELAGDGPGPDRGDHLVERRASSCVRRDRLGARLADGERRARVAPVAADAGNQVAEDEVAFCQRSRARRRRRRRRCEGRRRDRRAREAGLPHAPSIAPRTAAQSSSSETPAARVRAGRPLPGIADRDRGPDQLDLVGILDRPRGDERVVDGLPLETECERRGKRAGVDRDRRPVDHLAERPGGGADRVDRADPEARVGRDLAIRLARSVGLVVADDQDRACRHVRARRSPRGRTGSAPISISGAKPVSHVTVDGCATTSAVAPAASKIEVARSRRGVIRTSP